MKQGLSLLFMFLLFLSPVYATSFNLYPNQDIQVTQAMMPNENYIFEINVTNSRFIYIQSSENTTCLMSDNSTQKVLFETPYTDNITFHILGDAGPSIYKCNVHVETTVPDPAPVQVTGTGGGTTVQDRIPSELATELLNGSKMALPSDFVFPPEKTPVVLNVTQPVVLNYINITNVTTVANETIKTIDRLVPVKTISDRDIAVILVLSGIGIFTLIYIIRFLKHSTHKTAGFFLISNIFQRCLNHEKET